MRRFAAMLLTALVGAGPAAAAGGNSIASAPLIRPGVAASGDTSKDETGNGSIGSEESQGCWNDVEYWRLALTSGDQVLITGKALSPSHHFGIGMFPAGTTDRNLAKAAAVVSAFPRRGPIRFIARASGTHVLEIGPTCYNATDGPYTFVVKVRHKGG
jgi:hypothetical protein